MDTQTDAARNNTRCVVSLAHRVTNLTLHHIHSQHITTSHDGWTNSDKHVLRLAAKHLSRQGLKTPFTCSTPKLCWSDIDKMSQQVHAILPLPYHNYLQWLPDNILLLTVTRRHIGALSKTFNKSAQSNLGTGPRCGPVSRSRLPSRLEDT